ncbi:hypothetical protein MRB53_029862 [Persea americana]|uniref:Uncharacterized protein n=1 Tax=Persea americana TaxID=3435 RepID=A0ACC2KJY2_PERAE|nr:hypothetical protein MRB53_029862 [Persea americana]
MGRRKIKIRRLENTSARQITYSKRKAGLAKKAMELSVLCDINVALVMFSPAGKPTSYIGGNNDLNGILERFSIIPYEERTRRKLEILEILRKAFMKVDHEMDMERLLGDGVVQKIEDLQSQLKFKQALIQEKNRKISYWTNPEEVETFPEIVAMEECLVESLNRLHKRKVVLEEQNLHQTLSQTQNCPWPPAQYFPRLNVRAQVEQNMAMTMRDFGGHGNARGAAENVNMPFFNHAQLLSSVGPSYEVPPENLI